MGRLTRLMPFDYGKMPLYDGIMNLTVTIDKAGRIVIPKEIRDELRLEPGDAIALESESERITLTPLHAGTRLRKERGVWVFHGSKPLSLEQANELVAQTRARRDRHNPGERRR
jgi:AbrB family looped-hinge helix DNA binding protein